MWRHASVAAVVAVFQVCSSATPALLAQVATAAISGTVHDQTGAVLPGATITVRNVDTGLTREIETTDAEGRYRMLELSVGQYEVRAELQGFQTGVRRGIELTLGREAVVDFSLSIGDLTEEVVVTGEAPLVDMSGGSLGGVVNEQSIRELPLNGRDLSQLMTLEPGVVQVRRGSSGATGGFGARMSFAGARPDMVGWLLDGSDVNSTYKTGPAGAAGVQLGVEAVQEFRVMTSSYSAEYGTVAGGVVNSVTKSGTNQLHGSAFEFHRNSKLDARNFFDVSDSPPPFRRNQFGVSIGGPIIPNRAFFFGVYEGLREKLGATKIATVPTMAARQGIVPGRPPIAIHPSVTPLLNLLPAPNGRDFGNGTAESVKSTSDPTAENFATIRVDHSAGNNTLSSRFTMSRANRSEEDALGLLDSPSRTRRWNLSTELSTILSSRWLNKLRVAYNRSNDEDTFDALQDLSAMIRTPFPYPGTFSVPSITALGPNVTRPALFQNEQYEFADDVTYSSGNHTTKFGMLFRPIRQFTNQETRAGGRWTFASFEDFLAGNVNVFDAVLQGTDGIRNFRQNLFGVYAQESWRLHERLTINVGLRYEFVNGPREIDGKSGWVRQASDPEATIGPPFDPPMTNFAPRASFAWDPLGDGKTSVRGGVGLFYDLLLPRYWTSQSTKQPPFLRRGELRNAPMENSYEALISQGVPIRDEIWTLDYDIDTPYLMQFNFNLQRQLADELMVQVGYSGSRGMHLVRAGEANSAIPAILPDGQKFFPAGSVRRNPNFASDRRSVADSQSFYHALMIGLTKRFAGGSQLQGSYTWAKSIDEGSSTIAGALGASGAYLSIDFYDRRRNRGLSLFDVRHNFVVNYVWQLPGHDLTGAKGALLGGWQLGGVWTLQSGLAQTPNLSFTNSRNAATNNRFEVPNLKSGASNNPVLGGPERYFDASVFELAPAGFFGNLGRNTLIGPGLATVDASLVKNVRGMFESSAIQIRFEVFNLLNRTNFGLPAVESVVLRTGEPNPAAGRITSTSSTARQMQIGVKVLW